MTSREEFEKAYQDACLSRSIPRFDSAVFYRDHCDDYINSLVQSAWWGWQAARATSSLCPGHGRAECVSCCWPSTEQSAGYTAVDMGTAAADGYRDGVDQYKQDALRYRWLRANNYETGSYHPVGEFNHAAWFENLDDVAIDAAIAEEASE